MFGKAVATEFGEENIEQCFNQNGYESLGPETLTLREQIYVWNHAEAIACTDKCMGFYDRYSSYLKLLF